MSSPETQGRFLPMTPESRRAATKAAQAVGMPLADWLSQLIKSAGQPTQREIAEPPQPAQPEAAIPEAEVLPAPIAPLVAADAPGESFPTEDAPDEDKDGPIMVPASALRPSTICPEPEADEAEIRLIHRMLVEVGTFRPILVRPAEGIASSGKHTIYEIISGEQRWRAALRARMAEVPVDIRDCSDRDAQILAMCESLKRYAIPPIEEAEAYGRLKDEFELSVEEIAESVDKSVEHVSQMTRLLWLPPTVRQMIEDDRLTVPHARILLDADDPEAAAQEVLDRGLDIYRTEQMVRNQRAKASRGREGDDLAAGAEQ